MPVYPKIHHTNFHAFSHEMHNSSKILREILYIVLRGDFFGRHVTRAQNYYNMYTPLGYENIFKLFSFSYVSQSTNKLKKYVYRLLFKTKLI